ncbi:hypothetical protein E2C01_018503 [Portunus trituberculatus]|uniref:Uncharacterized protein n=1 Tax=Portunus trituberculatus TaxID=210409 RepID=A0A5B7DWK8_PORTR|nr:hypothetical protein [Portunus trituberculatus]
MRRRRRVRRDEGKEESVSLGGEPLRKCGQTAMTTRGYVTLVVAPERGHRNTLGGHFAYINTLKSSPCSGSFLLSSLHPLCSTRLFHLSRARCGRPASFTRHQGAQRCSTLGGLPLTAGSVVVVLLSPCGALGSPST